jgi:acyl carrier protein phosphodiesterase
MNYLAHALLSFDNENILIGNMIADFVKGKSMLLYNEKIQKGISLHRKIDTFTDQHPLFKKSVHRFDEKFGKYRFVITDVYYDHLLAEKWEQYSDISLDKFAQNTYSVIDMFQDILPKASLMTFDYMRKGNWLLNYKKEHMLKTYLGGLSNRCKYIENLEDSFDDFKANKNGFEEDFEIFMNEIIEYCKNEI